MSGVLSVSRYTDEQLVVFGEHGDIMVTAECRPGGLLHPENAEAGKRRPWFFTGSPYGGQIVALAWQRHAEKSRLPATTSKTGGA